MTSKDPLHSTADEVSPKVTASALGSLGAGVALAVLGALLTPEGQVFLGGLPPFLSFVIVAMLPPLLSFAAGYAKGDPSRKDIAR